MSLETEFHRELENQILNYLWNEKYKPLVNYQLPNGRIADIIYISAPGEITIIEVKTLLSSSLAEIAIDKYMYFCNRFYIAAPQDEILKIMAAEKTINWPNKLKNMGFIALRDHNVQIAKNARYVKLQPTVSLYVTAHITAKHELTSAGFYHFAKPV